MNNQGPPGPYIPRHMPEALKGLVGLALDLRWSWHHGSDQLWSTLDREMWESTANAWLVLNSVSGQRLQELAGDADFLALLAAQIAEQDAYNLRDTWCDSRHGEQAVDPVAFFCMEFGITESLPLYSGGLGVLAGDYLKAANDLGVPVVAVGLLYQQGFFRQALNLDGEQLEFHPYNDPTMLPLAPLRDDAGEWVRVAIELPGRKVHLRTWRGRVGRCELLLLDSNDPRNEPGDRGITSELYSGQLEKRLQQELVLGSGGWRLLEQLGLNCRILHLNEGHCAFAALERIRSFRQQHGLSFEQARHSVRPGNLFTTHTPVASGIDQYPPALVRLYLGSCCADLDLSVDQLLALGRDPCNGLGTTDHDSTEPLNMAWLAIRLCGRVNAVSQVHGKVSRKLFRPLFPRWPEADIPIEVVTNGVHTPSWDSPESDAVWTRACGKGRWCGAQDLPAEPLCAVTDEELWRMRFRQRQRLIGYARARLVAQHCEQDNPAQVAEACGLMLDSEALTLGFARRFTAYKRPDLLLYDEERLVRLLNDHNRPLQIVLSGKAHPNDSTGKAILRRWYRFINRPDVVGKVVFIEDYDLQVASQMVQGVDVWLNSPRHPWEACGTSGMKVLVNGGLNLSQFDGWWAEAYQPGVGWAIRPFPEFSRLDDSPAHDGPDAEELFDLLENQVIPAFYDCDEQGLPNAWIGMMRASMGQLTPYYSANRMVREYCEHFYLPMRQQLEARTPEVGRELDAWHSELTLHWQQLRFGQLVIAQEGDETVFRVQLHLDGLRPEWASVELVADPDGEWPPQKVVMSRSGPLAGTNTYTYECRVVTGRPAAHFTPRVVAAHPLASLPLEFPGILWFR